MVNDATSNVGFKGSVGSADLPFVLSRGARYGVLGAGDLKVSVGVGTRVLNVAAAPNGAWGDGVLSKWASGVTVAGAEVLSGTRYDTIHIKRTWTPEGIPTGKAEIVPTQGTSARAISGRGSDNPGVSVSHQPIALVRFVAGQTAAQEVIDLRVFLGDHGLYANAVEALQYLTDPGTQVRVGDVLYTRVVDPSSGASSWDALDLNALRAISRDSSNQTARLWPTGTFGTGAQFGVYDGDDSMAFQVPNPSNPSSPLTRFRVDSTGELTHGWVPYDRLTGEANAGPLTQGSGWAPRVMQLVRRGTERELIVELRRTGATIDSPANGNITETPLLTIPSGDAPSSLVPLTIAYRRDAGASGAVMPGFGYVSGQTVYLATLAPSAGLAQQTNSSVTSVWIRTKWNV